MEKLYMHMKTVYLLVTDTHFRSRNFPVRVNYEKECLYVVHKLEETIDKYKGQGYKVVLIWLGDVYHDSFKTVESALIWKDIVQALIEKCEDCYGVLGNHEKTYAKDNPFWSLVAQLHSKRVYKSNKKNAWQPKGSKNWIKIVDLLEGEDFRFVFNHHDSGVETPLADGKINIGLFHQDIHSDKMILDAKAAYDIDVYKHDALYFDKDSRVFIRYDYAFLGHAHWNYGTWVYLDEKTGQRTVIYNLGSLGRTNEREVNDSFLERNIPAVVTDSDGKFSHVEDNMFNLMSRQQCVLETKVVAERANREKLKENLVIRQEIRSGITPTDRVTKSLESFGDNGRLSYIFDIVKQDRLQSLEQSIMEGLVINGQTNNTEA